MGYLRPYAQIRAYVRSEAPAFSRLALHFLQWYRATTLPTERLSLMTSALVEVHWFLVEPFDYGFVSERKVAESPQANDVQPCNNESFVEYPSFHLPPSIGKPQTHLILSPPTQKPHSVKNRHIDPNFSFQGRHNNGIAKHPCLGD